MIRSTGVEPFCTRRRKYIPCSALFMSIAVRVLVRLPLRTRLPVASRISYAWPCAPGSWIANDPFEGFGTTCMLVVEKLLTPVVSHTKASEVLLHPLGSVTCTV